jgi:hypothetical protein
VGLPAIASPAGFLDEEFTQNLSTQLKGFVDCQLHLSNHYIIGLISFLETIELLKF